MHGLDDPTQFVEDTMREMARMERAGVFCPTPVPPAFSDMQASPKVRPARMPRLVWAGVAAAASVVLVVSGIRVMRGTNPADSAPYANVGPSFWNGLNGERQAAAVGGPGMDYAAFSSCISGPGHDVDAGCRDADLDTDGDVDLADFRMFQSQIVSATP